MSRFVKFLLGLSLVLLILLGILLWVYFSTNKRNLSLNQATTNQTTGNTMETVLGTTWTNYGKKDSTNPGMFDITVVSDGVVHRDILPIKTKEGEVLASVILYFQGYYYDARGVRQTLIIPSLIKLPDNKLFHPLYRDTITWSDALLETKIKEEPDAFGSAKGVVMTVLIFKDPILTPAIPSGNSVREEIIPIINNYNLSWKTELDQLIASGNPSITILFPYSFSKSYDNQYVDLK